MVHCYKRNGTTTLFAALNVLNGTEIGRKMQRHRHQEFIHCWNLLISVIQISRATSAGVITPDAPIGSFQFDAM
jgi:hypothetical protein